MINDKRNDFPRKGNLTTMVPSELAIYNAIGEVEKIGADPVLTNAVCQLQEALRSVSNYLDAQFEIK